MLSLDEAISQEKELFEHCKRLYEPLSDEDKSINPLLKNEIEYHKQLAEWLEELKILRENANGYNKEDIELNRNAMYNKAIDDAIDKISCGGKYNMSLVDELRKLKVGGRE